MSGDGELDRPDTISGVVDPVSTEAPEIVDPGKLPSSLRLKTTLLAFLATIVLALSAMMFFLVTRVFDRLTPSIHDDLVDKAVIGAHRLAEATELAVAAGEAERVRETLEDYDGGDDILALVAVDASGGIAAKRGEPVEEIGRLFSGPEGMARETEEYIVAWAGGDIEGSLVSRVAVVVSKARLHAGGKLRTQILILAGISGLVSLLLGLLFVSFHIGPLVSVSERALLALRELALSLEERVRTRTRQLTRSKQRLEANLARLHEAQRKLMEVSRHAGMAEVATSVLHNVGNVLNTVNVSGNMVTDTLRRSKVGGLQRAVELMRAHEADLGAFLTTDEKGKRLRQYLNVLAQELADERATMQREMENLTVNIDHIKVIVSMQQTHAKSAGGMSELVSPGEIVEDAINFNLASFRNHGVVIEKQVDALPPMLLDRHKLMQILMNLLSNARHAVAHRENGGGLVRVTLRSDGGRFVVEVVDNGIGIPLENQKNIFVHGFTTKKDGHGFGLHSSALTARELGGSLSFHSDGAGAGTTFVLELPETRAAASLSTSDASAVAATG